MQTFSRSDKQLLSSKRMSIYIGGSQSNSQILSAAKDKSRFNRRSKLSKSVQLKNISWFEQYCKDTV